MDDMTQNPGGMNDMGGGADTGATDTGMSSTDMNDEDADDEEDDEASDMTSTGGDDTATGMM